MQTEGSSDSPRSSDAKRGQVGWHSVARISSRKAGLGAGLAFSAPKGPGCFIVSTSWAPAGPLCYGWQQPSWVMPMTSDQRPALSWKLTTKACKAHTETGPLCSKDQDWWSCLYSQRLGHRGRRVRSSGWSLPSYTTGLSSRPAWATWDKWVYQKINNK